MLGAILGGIASSVIGGLMSKSSARDQMGFQEQMSSTSYQRAMEDMRQAGLNPMLAYQQGGASTPGGASWQMPDMMQSISSAVGAKRQEKLMGAEYNNLEAQSNLRDNEGAILVQQHATAKAQAAQSKIDEQYWKSSAGKAARIAELAANSANAVASVVKPWVGAPPKSVYHYRAK